MISSWVWERLQRYTHFYTKETQTNISPHLLHTAHGAAKYDDVLLDAPLGHFIEIVQALLPLKALLTGHEGRAEANDRHRHLTELHFVK